MGGEREGEDEVGKDKEERKSQEGGKDGER